MVKSRKYFLSLAYLVVIVLLCSSKTQSNNVWSLNLYQGIFIGLIISIFYTIIVKQFFFAANLRICLFVTIIIAIYLNSLYITIKLSILFTLAFCNLILSFTVLKAGGRGGNSALIAIYIAIIFISLFEIEEKLDFLFKPSIIPIEISELLSSDEMPKISFYSYTLYELVDREYLWRISDRNGDLLSKILNNLNLPQFQTMPKEFWEMSPYYWPKSKPADSFIFKSINFDAQTRGDDGSHYLILYDTNKNTLFVWYKANF